MKNYGPIYTILATMAVAAVAIGAEPIRHHKQLDLSKSEARKSGYALVIETAGNRLPGQRIMVLDAKAFEARMSADLAVAIAMARARKRTG